jgi:hypothetical protein
MLVSIATEAAPKRHRGDLGEDIGEASGDADRHARTRANRDPNRTMIGAATEGGNTNEDYVAATSDAIVLLDGGGAASGAESGCSHGVPWYVRSLGAALLGDLAHNDGPLAQILTDGIAHVGSLHGTSCDLSHPGSPSAAVVMMRRTAGTMDFLVLANAVIVLDIGLTEPMVIRDERPLRAGYRSRPAAEHTNASGHRGRALWAASGDPTAAEQSLTGSVPADQARAAALLSAGASRLVDRFSLISWRQLLALVARHGPAEAIRQARAAEDSDPTGERWPRTPLHDDASVAYWEFTARPPRTGPLSSSGTSSR